MYLARALLHFQSVVIGPHVLEVIECSNPEPASDSFFRDKSCRGARARDLWLSGLPIINNSTSQHQLRASHSWM